MELELNKQAIANNLKYDFYKLAVKYYTSYISLNLNDSETFKKLDHILKFLDENLLTSNDFKYFVENNPTLIELIFQSIKTKKCMD